MNHNYLSRITSKLKSEISFYKRNYFRNTAKLDFISKRMIWQLYPGIKSILDCGAHTGTDSIEMLRFFPKANIYCFEPIPIIFESLRRNTFKYPNINCFKTALSFENGRAIMNVSEGGSDASSSLMEPAEHINDHPEVRFGKKIEVLTITLDDWARDIGINHLDFLWLDMQGMEMAMLMASKTILPTVKVIHTEVSTRETYKGVPNYDEYRRFLEKKGFRVVIEAIPSGWDMGNVLFVR